MALTAVQAIAVLSLSAAQACPPPSGTPDAAVPDAAPPRPTLASDQLVFDSTRSSSNHEIFVMNSDGTGALRLTDNPAYENWWPRISPDRSRVLFYRSPAGDPEDYSQASLWVMNADGTGATQLRARGQDGWTAQGHGEWSPDGTRLLLNGCPGTPCVPASYEIYVMPAVPSGAVTRLTTDGVASYDPYFSPDGTQLAWLVNVDPAANVIPGTSTALGRWAIRIADADGSHARYLIDDGNINSKPAWSRDGQTVYFHRMVPPDYRFQVYRIAPNGTGLTELTPGAPGISEHPSN